MLLFAGVVVSWALPWHAQTPLDWWQVPFFLVLAWAKFQEIYGKMLIGLAAKKFYLTELQRWLWNLIMLTKNIAMQSLYVLFWILKQSFHDHCILLKAMINWSLHSAKTAKGLFLSFSKVVQATSNQMSKRDPVRPCMDVIDNMLAQMVWMLRYHLELTFKYCDYSYNS